LAALIDPDLKEILGLLVREARRISSKIPATTWYLFGSFAVRPGTANDIDVMVLCGTERDAAQVRTEMKLVCLELPIHLFLVTHAEEAELGFIESQRCQQLWPLPGL
jgi:predicted nucleotidyltransferase